MSVNISFMYLGGFPDGSEVSNLPASVGDVGLIPQRRKWQPTLVFLPGKSHQQRSLGSQRVRHDLASKQQQCWMHVYLQLLSLLVGFIPLSIFLCLMLQSVLKSVLYKYFYPGFLLISIRVKYHFPSVYFQIYVSLL